VRERCLAMIELERKHLLNVSNMGGTVSEFLLFLLCYEYPTSPFSLCIYKGNERMGI
jgi:hypothetical protein